MNMYTLQTPEPWKHKVYISHNVSSYIALHSICTLGLHVCKCVCVCDCSDSLIMALPELKHGSFNNKDYWELFIDSVFIGKNQCISNCKALNAVHY
jgi:hypothetical protein